MLIPLELMHRVQATKEVLGITLRLQPGVHYLAATREIESWFQRSAPGMRVRVDSPAWLVEQMERQMRLFAILLGSLAGIALVVGGFGIMNAMLASVTERRQEIGIRRAIGARQRDLQLQFLAESAVLCVLGGLLGALIGTVATDYQPGGRLDVAVLVKRARARPDDCRRRGPCLRLLSRAPGSEAGPHRGASGCLIARALAARAAN